MRPTDIEYLLLMSQDVADEGSEVLAEQRRAIMAHVKRVMELEEMWQRAGDNLKRERQRFSQWFPAQIKEESLPRIVQRGPAALPEHLRPGAKAAE